MTPEEIVEMVERRAEIYRNSQLDSEQRGLRATASGDARIAHVLEMLAEDLRVRLGIGEG